MTRRISVWISFPGQNNDFKEIIIKCNIFFNALFFDSLRIVLEFHLTGSKNENNWQSVYFVIFILLSQVHCSPYFFTPCYFLSAFSVMLHYLRIILPEDNDCAAWWTRGKEEKWKLEEKGDGDEDKETKMTLKENIKREETKQRKRSRERKRRETRAQNSPFSIAEDTTS